MELTHQLAAPLKQLRLSGILDTLESRNQQAIKDKASHIDFLARLLEGEVKRRAQKQLELRLRRSTVNSTKTLESFDFGFNPNLNRQQILELATGNYIRQKKNVLLCGPTGTGKTHLAQALTHEACRQGFDVYFGNTHKLLQHLQAGRADHSFERRLHSLAHHVEILVLEGASFRAKGRKRLEKEVRMKSE